VVVGVILIAGAVALLLWRDDTGEGYLARLGSQSEAALAVDGENGGDSNSDDDGPVGGDSNSGDDGSVGGDSAAPAGTDAVAALPDEEPSGADGSDADGGPIAEDPVGTTERAAPEGSAANDTTEPTDATDDDTASAGTTEPTDATGDDISRADRAPSDQVTTVSAGNDGDGGDDPVIVTVTDILRMVNRIAQLNGYAPIGSMAPDARDPDWIFPGNELELPNQRLYEIRRGDTMWAIADRFIQQSAQEHNRALSDLSERIQQGERPTQELQVLLDEAYVESTRRRAGELLTEIGVE
jgi:hypothetical protein